MGFPIMDFDQLHYIGDYNLIYRMVPPRYMLVYNPINYTSIYHKPENSATFFRQLSLAIDWGAHPQPGMPWMGRWAPRRLTFLSPGLMHAKGFDFETNDPVPKVPIEHHH